MCSIFLIKPQSKKTVVFLAKYRMKQVTLAILNCASVYAANRFATRLLPCRCSKSDQKSALRVCQIATVVMETTQLVLSGFKKHFIVVNGELKKIYLCQK